MYLSLNMSSGLAEASPHFLQVNDILCDGCEMWYVQCVECDVQCVMRGA